MDHAKISQVHVDQWNGGGLGLHWKAAHI